MGHLTTTLWNDKSHTGDSPSTCWWVGRWVIWASSEKEHNKTDKTYLIKQSLGWARDIKKNQCYSKGKLEKLHSLLGFLQCYQKRLR